MSGKNETTEKAKLQGQHMLADLFGIEDARLKDANFFIRLLKELATSIHLTPLEEPHVVRYSPNGCTGFILLKESHISFHTYPEANYLAFDIFTCEDIDLEDAFTLLCETFSPKMVRKTTITRGLQG
ncbi:MAG: adenosylmethionine decarboxylase [Acidobacteriota bacterium]